MDIDKADVRVLEADVLKDTGLGKLAAVVARPADQGEAHVSSHAGDVQHDSLLARTEGLQKLLADDGRTQDVDLEAGPPALEILLDEGAVVWEVAGVVDEDVGGAKGLEDGGDGGAIGDVSRVGLEGDSGEFLGEGLLGLLDAGLVAAQDANTLDARGGDASGDVLPDTTTGASNKRALARERAAWKRGGERGVGLLVVGDKRRHSAGLAALGSRMEGC